MRGAYFHMNDLPQGIVLTQGNTEMAYWAVHFYVQSQLYKWSFLGKGSVTSEYRLSDCQPIFLGCKKNISDIISAEKTFDIN